MRIVRNLTGLGVAVALVLFGAPPASAAIDDAGTVWVYGQTYTSDAPYCLAKGAQAKNNRPVLQFRTSAGSWETVSVAKVRKNKRCRSQDPEYGYRAWFTFTVSELGRPIDSKKGTLEARIAFNRGDGTKVPFAKTVYVSKEAAAERLLEAFAELLNR